MTTNNSPIDNPLYRDILDAILFRDPPRDFQQADVADGVTRMRQIVTFVDGSIITISAQVPLAPLSELTPEKVTFIKPNGERGERWDDGSSESLNLARQAAAIRLMEKISEILDTMPEQRKVVCPVCHGNRYCVNCTGQGCTHCAQKGACPECGGRGLIAQF